MYVMSNSVIYIGYHARDLYQLLKKCHEQNKCPIKGTNSPSRNNSHTYLPSRFGPLALGFGQSSLPPSSVPLSNEQLVNEALMPSPTYLCSTTARSFGMRRRKERSERTWCQQYHVFCDLSSKFPHTLPFYYVGMLPIRRPAQRLVRHSAAPFLHPCPSVGCASACSEV